jgi:hypothetical protein
MGTSPSLRSNELPEYPFTGPFGGVQSEVPLDRIGRNGFAEVQNVLFRKSHAQSMPGFTALPRPAYGSQIYQLVGDIGGLSGAIAGLSSSAFDGPVIGIADFFNVNGVRCFVIWTPTSMYTWNGGTWQQIAGTLHGSSTQYMSWDIIGYKLYFSQQQDIINYWDGIANSFSQASASAVPAKYLCELNFHLLAANCLVGGVAAPNAIFWSGIGNGQDWSSFSYGSNNLFNGLGPINGLARIYQAGYAFQQWGIVQIVPTGIEPNPFDFITMGSRAKGSITPYGLASFGEIMACYIGKDDIYIFDGTESTGIGSRPIDGNRRLGARLRIFNDLYSTSLGNIFGVINTSNNGADYESYWILIPGLNKAWIYHFDEGSWTQVYFNPGQLLGPVGIFTPNNSGGAEIGQLVGSISAQSWSPSTLTNVVPLDTLAISDGNAKSISTFQPSTSSSFPTSGSITSTDGWYLRTGQLTFDDPRHAHTLKSIRFTFIDYATITVNVRVTNEFGQQQTATISYGSGSGQSVVKVQEFRVPGKYLTIELSGPKGVQWGMSEMSPIYDVGGEIQGGTR